MLALPTAAPRREPLTRAGGMIRQIGSDLASLISPPSCSGCLAPLAAPRLFCGRCEVALSEHDPAACPSCGGPATRRGTCRGCALRLAPLDAVHCAFEHDGPLAQALHAFKYGGRDELGPGLAEAWLRALGRLGPPGWLEAGAVFVPVPLHRSRLRARGFDQAWLLARSLAHALGAPA
ncbi:MAG: hypothetical protein ACYCWW_14245, partial [Deltaproteobacteria bacterium]